VSKAQDFYSDSLDSSLAAMMARLQTKVVGYQDDHTRK